MDDNKRKQAERITLAVNEVQELHASRKQDPEREKRHVTLSEWQARRLARTHSDLLESDRYRLAAEFFLSDLYGPKDFSARDRDLGRILPIMVKMLPAHVLATVADAMELNVMSFRLDERLIQAINVDGELPAVITPEAYAGAYRLCDNKADRVRQIDMIQQLGEDLDRFVHKPFIYTALKLCHRPAHMAGFGELQDFLERGFGAFKHMGGAEDFLRIIVGRERAILENLFENDPDPFRAPPLTASA